MKAVRKHTDNKWVILYIERWLTTPMQLPDGSLQEKTKGVMQGGVISPVLSNLFLHYAFDVWMKKNHPSVPWCRYADDGLAHGRAEKQVKQLLAELTDRFRECGLELHPDKTNIVYCKDGKRRKDYSNKAFNFLGYEFRERLCKIKDGNLFVGFTPGVSKQALKSMRETTRNSGLRNRTDLSLDEIAKWFNPILQGWLNYYGKYNKSALSPVWMHFNETLMAWAMRKYRSITSRTKASLFLGRIAKKEPSLFAHWRAGMVGVFV